MQVEVAQNAISRRLIRLLNAEHLKRTFQLNEEGDGYDLIAGEIPKELPIKLTVKFTYLINVCMRYVPNCFKKLLPKSLNGSSPQNNRHD